MRATRRCSAPCASSDAVLVGTGTPARRKLRPDVPTPTRGAPRDGAGRGRRAPGLTLTRSGGCPRDPAVRRARGRVIVFSGPRSSSGTRRPGRGRTPRPGRLTLPLCCATCARDYGVRPLLCEGGPDAVRRPAPRAPCRRAVPDPGPQADRRGRRARRSPRGPELPEPAAARCGRSSGTQLYLRYRLPMSRVAVDETMAGSGRLARSRIAQAQRPPTR